MDWRETYERWVAATASTPIAEELIAIRHDDREIAERFTGTLTFGTAGLRGVMGAGTARMNIYTVRQATQGVADYINSCYGGGSVAVAYDTRHNSELFARETAEVLAANKVKVHLFGTAQPTPVLSFAVRSLECTMGIMITASHNPAQYNGYKVFGSDGCQIGVAEADAILHKITAVDIFDDVKTLHADSAENEFILKINDRLLRRYRRAVLDCSVYGGAPMGILHVVYTPLHGTGMAHVPTILSETGVNKVDIVECQREPDGDFTTCEYPNPEMREALSEGMRQCMADGADILLATDPDSDRVGVACRTGTNMRIFTGNEIGVLLLDFILRRRKKSRTLPERPVAVKSMVSTPLADLICAKYGAEMRTVPTGFKNIGEQILMLEQAGETDRYIFGFEESCGYLPGAYVRDKDAQSACLLLCELASECKSRGMTLSDLYDAISDEHGYFLCETMSFSATGLEGLGKLAMTMKRLRDNPPHELGGADVLTVSDYLSGEQINLLTGLKSKVLSGNDMLEWGFESGAKVIIRPSGTEPKLKVYVMVNGADAHTAEQNKYAVESAVITLVAM